MIHLFSKNSSFNPHLVKSLSHNRPLLLFTKVTWHSHPTQTYAFHLRDSNDKHIRATIWPILPPEVVPHETVIAKVLYIVAIERSFGGEISIYVGLVQR